MKNIIYITGNDSYGVELEVKRWISVFESKYSNINIERIRLENRSDFAIIRDNLTTTGLFADKRLFLFSGGIEKKSKNGGIEELLDTIRADIPEDHFCIFHNISSKEEGLITWLIKNSDMRSVNTVWNVEVWETRFPTLSKKEIGNIVTAYQDSEATHEIADKNPNIGHVIAGTLETLSLLDRSPHVIPESLIHTEGGGKIFDLVDLILAEKAQESIKLLRRIIETIDSAELLPSLIGLLRSHLYIKFLQNEGKSMNEIGSLIKVHPFVLKKSISSRISLGKLGKFFSELIHANKAYKSGKGLENSELGRIFSIELALIGLKK